MIFFPRIYNNLPEVRKRREEERRREQYDSYRLKARLYNKVGPTRGGWSSGWRQQPMFYVFQRITSRVLARRAAWQ